MITKKNARIVFMGTPDIATSYLQCLVDNHFNIVGVYSQPPRRKDRGMTIKKSPVQILSEKNNIPSFTPSFLNNKDEFKRLKNLRSDIVIVMGYGILLPKFFLDCPVFGCINIHLSLLPKLRGAAPIEHALIIGEKETGVTIFKLTEKLDTGPILGSDKCFITDLMTKNELQNILNNLGKNLLLRILPKYLAKKLILKEQDDDQATYARKILSKDRKINFYENSKNVFNKIRSFEPRTGAWFVLNRERIKIISCIIESQKGEPSTILSKDFLIGCNDGSIKPLIIQREGKRPMNIKDFLMGFNFKVGEKLNIDE